MLCLLFKYVENPIIKDIENIATEIGYLFDSIIGLYCKYRNNGGLDCLSPNGILIDKQTVSCSRDQEIPEVGTLTDLAYSI